MGERVCGSCTLCCKVMGIKELKKPRNHWCPHAKKGVGCSIYTDRPPSCVEFECLWLQKEDIPDEFRPDKIHAFFTDLQGNEGIAVHLDPGYPLAHLDEPLVGLLKRIAARGLRVMVICGERVYFRHHGEWIRANKVEITEEKMDVEIKE